MWHVLILLVLTTCAVSCRDVTTLRDQVFAPDKELLSVTTDMHGTVYPREGTLLTLRVYESGKAEYDYFPPQEARLGNGVTRMEIQISRAQLERLEDLLARLEPAVKQNSYPNNPCELFPDLDSTFIRNVSYRIVDERKGFSVRNYADGTQQCKSFYPAPLVELFDWIDLIKGRTA